MNLACRFLILIASPLALSACSDEPGNGKPPDGNPAQAKNYAPPSGPKIPADKAKIEQMLTEKFGRDVRAVRIEVESDERGARVRLRGEVPSEQAKEAVIREVVERVENLRIQDFDLAVSGPVSMIGIVEAEFGEEGAIFSSDLHYGVILGQNAPSSPAIYDLWAGVRINQLGTQGMPAIKTLALSPNGKTLATGHQDGQITLWDMPLCREPSVFEKAGDIRSYNYVAAMAFSSDGKYLASIQSEKGEVWLWSLEASREARLLGTHNPNQQYLLAFSPDAKLLASGDNQGNDIDIWDVAARSRKIKLDGKSMHLEALAWAPDSKSLVAGRLTQGQGLMQWTVGDGKSQPLNFSKGGMFRDLCFAPDGKTLAARLAGVEIVLWDVPGGKEWLTLEAQKIGYGRGMAFSPDGAVLAVVCKQTAPTNSGPSAFQFWDVSRRPGASGDGGEFPPKNAPPSAQIRDDMLAQQIAARVQGTFGRGKQILKEISVEVLPDGTVKLKGKINSAHAKESAERTVTSSFPIQDKNGIRKRKVINELEVVGY